MTMPQRWMIRTTYSVIVVAAVCCCWLPGWVPWCVAVGRVALAGSAILGAPMVRLQESCYCNDMLLVVAPPSTILTMPSHYLASLSWLFLFFFFLLFLSLFFLLLLLLLLLLFFFFLLLFWLPLFVLLLVLRLLLLCGWCFSTCSWPPGWVPWCVAVGRVALAGSAILGAPMVRLPESCYCDFCCRCLPRRSCL